MIEGIAERMYDDRSQGVNLSKLVLTSAVYDSIRAHGEETYPDECCGALLGYSTEVGWQVVAAARAANAQSDSAHNRYSIAPLDLVRMEREARRNGFEIAGFYHSHPDHPARWSSIDLCEAHWLCCSYVITTVERGKATVTNAFLLSGATEEDKQFEQQEIEIIDRPDEAKTNQ